MFNKQAILNDFEVIQLTVAGVVGRPGFEVSHSVLKESFVDFANDYIYFAGNLMKIDLKHLPDVHIRISLKEGSQVIPAWDLEQIPFFINQDYIRSQLSNEEANPRLVFMLYGLKSDGNWKVIDESYFTK